MMTEQHFWLGVVSREHVIHGVTLGIAQLNHGKRAPLARMQQGDWLVYYSPRTSYPAGQPLQAFTAIGQIVSAAPYAVTISEDFHPFRHTVVYRPCREVPIQDVLAQLTCLPDQQHWGARLRFGQIALPQQDFLCIARAMGVTIPEIEVSTDAALAF